MTTDEALVEKAAREMYESNHEFHVTIHAERGMSEVEEVVREPWPTATEYFHDLYRTRARAVIAAVADDIRAQALRDAALDPRIKPGDPALRVLLARAEVTP